MNGFQPKLLSLSQKLHPGISFQISEESTEHLLVSIGNGTLDLAILSPPIADEHLRLQELFEDEFLLALPAHHFLSKSRYISLQALQDLPMILMNDAHCLRGQTISFCQRVGFVPKVFIQSSQLATVLALVETGQGISLVPAIAKSSFAPCAPKSSPEKSASLDHGKHPPAAPSPPSSTSAKPSKVR